MADGRERWLKVHFHPVDLVDADVVELTDLVAVEELHATRPLVEVIAERNAAVPVLYLPRLHPEGDVDGVGSLQHLADGRDMDGVHAILK